MLFLSTKLSPDVLSWASLTTHFSRDSPLLKTTRSANEFRTSEGSASFAKVLNVNLIPVHPRISDSDVTPEVATIVFAITRFTSHHK